MALTADQRFEFDLSGFLHLRGALTPAEVAEYTRWMDSVDKIDVKALNAATPDWMQHHLNRPVSRVIDADPRFARFLDHPVVEPLLSEMLGADYRHIDNDLLYTHPGYKGGGWHRGVKVHPTGHVRDGAFICPMVKVFYCMTDVGPNEGNFEVIPGSHRAQFEIPMDRVDLPGQHIFEVRAGDIILFNEGLLHNGRPNPSQRLRKTIVMNLGRADAGVWAGYTPLEKTLAAVSPRQRAILTNAVPVWVQPVLT